MFWSVTLSLLEGLREVVKLFALTLVFSLPLGLAVTFGSMSKCRPVSWFFNVLVWIVRGTPLMLQLLAVTYGPYYLFGMTVAKNKLIPVVIAFAINYAAYFAEIFRGGIQSIPVGQREAGQVLGMTKAQIFFKVVLFQVIKRIVPPMGNEIITLVKDTSLARVIAVVELVKAAETIVSLKSLIWPLFYVGAFYLLFTGIVTLLLNYAEKKLNYYQG